MTRAKDGNCVDTNCGRCEKFLAGVPAGSFIYCPRCSKWVKAGGDQDKQQAIEINGKAT